MSTTQYIGARYVPIFADPIEWNDSRIYEPLTIVVHDGNSYTSRQFVPKGIDIGNDDFWALSGNYNAQVEQYRNEVKSFDGRITANSQAVENEAEARKNEVTTETNRAKGAEQTLQKNIDAEKTRAQGAEQTLQKNIDAEKTRAQGEVALLRTEKTVMLSFGDSFGDERTEWPFKLASKFGLKCDSFNIGGDVWPWTNGLNNAKSKYDTEEKKATIAFAVAYGGINQILSNPLTNEKVITNFISAFNNAFPGVKLYIAPLNNCSPGNTNFPNIYRNALQSYNPLMNKLRQYDGDFILLSNSIWYNTGALNSWKEDKLHPNELGSTLIANNMAMAINGTNTFSQAIPVFGEHDGWDIVTDSYVADGYIVTCGAINNKVTTKPIYNYLYGIKPLIKVIKPSMPVTIRCDIYTFNGIYKNSQYAYYSVDDNNLQSLINCNNLKYDATDVVYIQPTMIPIL